MTTGLLLAISLGAYLLAAASARSMWKLWLGATMVAGFTSLSLAFWTLISGNDWEWHSSLAVGGEHLFFRLDGISAVFLALLSLMGPVGGLYSVEYWSNGKRPQSASSGRFWWTVLFTSMTLLTACSNGLHFLVIWEVFAIAAYFLITLDRQNTAARSAGWLYLAASHAGTLLLILFFAALAAKTGSWELGSMRNQPELTPLFWLAFLGFGVKAGLFPLHIWLPTAHANSPSHVSAAMSGVALKMGVFGIVRFGGWLPVSREQALTVIALGALGAVLGITFSLVQNDYKRLLAYCSVENIGVILVALGLGFLGAVDGNAQWGRLALAGALLHVWNHGLFKTLLFFGSGSLLHATGTREMSRLGGLWRSMPWTFSFVALGSVAVSSLPPLNGFASKWLIYKGLFSAGISRSESTWAALPAAIGIAVAGALTLAAFIKLCSIIFLGAPRSTATQGAHECGLWMRVSMGMIAALCLFQGFAPQLAWPLIQNAVGDWGAFAVPFESHEPLRALGTFHLALAIALTAGVGLFIRRTNATGPKRSVTWDCGYAKPTSRMQYTSASFGQIVRDWGRCFLWPDTRIERPQGIFPKAARWRERVPEPVLEFAVEPFGRGLYWLAKQTRRLQHGRLQFYIFYVVIGVVGVALVALHALKQ